MRLFLFACLLALFSADLTASQPSQQGQRIWPRIDLIPPLGVKLSPSYARLHNRPSRRVGRWADHLAPTSRIPDLDGVGGGRDDLYDAILREEEGRRGPNG